MLIKKVKSTYEHSVQQNSFMKELVHIFGFPPRMGKEK